MTFTENWVGTGSHIGEPGEAYDQDDNRPRITVIYTTLDGTRAALEAAVHLSTGLGAEIVMLVAEKVAIYYPLNYAHLAARFFEGVRRKILKEMRMKETSVKLEIYFCRRRVQCFEAMLDERSIVVLGTQRRWWQFRERRLVRALKLLGHDPVLVRPQDKTVVPGF
jgi:hypothetical protein